MFGVCQWEKIAANMEKDPLECQDFYTFLMNCASRLLKEKRDESESEEELPMMRTSNDILQNKPIKDKKKKRHRRKASQIDRMYKCQEKHCNRSYGTEGALKMHIKIKHPYVHYDTKYSKGKLIKKDKINNNELTKIKKPENDIDLVESSYLLTNLSHTIESHQPLIATPAPISYTNFVQRIDPTPSLIPQTLPPSVYDPEKLYNSTNTIIPSTTNTIIPQGKSNVMSLNNLINTQ